MIIAKIVSGLGNQLFQYALGRRLSLLKKTSLKLDISFYEQQNLRSFKLHHYRIDAPVATPAEIQHYTRNQGNLSSKIYWKIQRLLPQHKRSVFRERQWWVYEPDVWKVSSRVYLDGYWQHYNYFEAFQEQMRQDLTLQTDFSHLIGAISKQILENNSSVSIHIRRGDYITDQQANQLMGVLPLTYYQQAIATITEKVPDPCFYIFSDDLDWAAEALRIPYPVVMVDVAGGKYDFLELELMSRCKHNIIANSSFSWWGAYLNSNPNKLVVCPTQWCLPADVNRRVHLQHPDWLKL